MKTQAIAQLKLQRISAQKARLVADLIRNKKTSEALSILKNSNKKAARLLLKLLQSAIANAINNNGMDIDKLFLAEVFLSRFLLYSVTNGCTKSHALTKDIHLIKIKHQIFKRQKKCL